MKRGMNIEYLKYRADLNFKFDINFGVNGTIGTIVSKWGLLLFGQWIVFIRNIIFLNTHHMPLITTLTTK